VATKLFTYLIIPYFLMLALASRDEDDDDMGPGMFVPAAQPTS